jgi:preprotein translocase subunit YajC
MMNFATLNPLFAEATAGAQQDPTGQMVTTIGMFAIMGIMFYFVLIRPQQKRAKEQALLIEAVKPGDKIVTTSGIIGIVIGVKEKTVSIRSADSKMEILKSTVGEITERGGETPESKS